MSFLIPIAYAHEVYVLSDNEVTEAMTHSSRNPIVAIPEHAEEFTVWFGIVFVCLFILIWLSSNIFLQKICAPTLRALKQYAPLVARITLGLSLFFSGYFGDIFGPELLFTSEYQYLAPAMSILFIALGIFMVFGLFTRITAIISLMLFTGAVFTFHFYMLTYANYVGEMLIMLILGGGMWSLDRHVQKLQFLDRFFHPLHKLFEQYGFLILRVLFGVSLIYASFYAKFLHSNLALTTVNAFHLTQYFHFNPLFLVLGAFFIESLIGIAFILGFAVRFFAVVLFVFLTLSILFFGESVWPHIILFGVTTTIFLHGYDKYTLGALLFKKSKNLEPVV